MNFKKYYYNYSKFIVIIYSFLLVFALALNSSKVVAQEDGDDIVLGKYHVIQSKILNEERRLLVSLPDDYNQKTIDYPVLYLLYGNHLKNYFIESVYAINSLSTSGKAPPIILVGIEVIDHGFRDLQIINMDGSDNTVGVNNFIKFFENELIPFIDKKYRTNSFRIIGGPQGGANFALYSQMTNPKLFQFSIINNPVNPGTLEPILEKLEQYFSTEAKSSTYLTYEYNAVFGKQILNQIEAIKNLYKKYNPRNIKFEFNYLVDFDEHIPPLCLKKGLKFYFKDYAIPSDYIVNNADDFIHYYANLYDQYGFKVYPADYAIIGKGVQFKQQQEFQEAIKLFSYFLSYDPNSLNAHFQIAFVYKDLGMKELAIHHLKKCIEIDPAISHPRRVLEELESK